MKISSFSLLILGSLLMLPVTSTAYAQATRTWVSGVGDDANPCSRTAPCKTFAGAISKTAAQGEIDCLDPGGFGAVTITKAITIDCAGGEDGGVLVQGTNGIVVSAGVNDKVILRNMTIQGLNVSPSGISWSNGLELTVDNVHIQGFTVAGINVAKSATGILHVRRSAFATSGIGIKLATTAGSIVASIDHVDINGMGTNGVEAASASVFADVSNSVIAACNGSGLIASASGATMNGNNNTLSANATGMNASVSGANIAASNNFFGNNTTAFNVAAGGSFLTDSTNKINGTPGSTNTGTLNTR